MDVDRARELAIVEFASRMAQSGDTWRPDDWEVSGPHEEEVYGVGGPRPCLIFAFIPRDAEASGSFTLRIAVDDETGEAGLLR